MRLSHSHWFRLSNGSSATLSVLLLAIGLLAAPGCANPQYGPYQSYPYPGAYPQYPIQPSPGVGVAPPGAVGVPMGVAPPGGMVQQPYGSPGYVTIQPQNQPLLGR